MANQISWHFLTKAIITLHARQPLTKAATKPMSRGCHSMVSGSFINLMPSNKASPKIGGMTMRNENCAKSAFLTPNSRPVAMVEPERDKPGNTATACAQPMMKASNSEISFFSFGRI